MTIALVVTRGYSNGTLTGTIADILTRGYTIGPEALVLVDLAPATVEGQAVLRITEGLNITREAISGSIKRIVEGLR